MQRPKQDLIVTMIKLPRAVHEKLREMAYRRKIKSISAFVREAAMEKLEREDK